jgi:succinate dehydrogenase / fumarate reductase flavoprotein subunit
MIEKVLRAHNEAKIRSGPSPLELKKHLQRVADSKLGVVRDEKSLKKAIDELSNIKKEIPRTQLKSTQRQYNREWLDLLQLKNMATTLEMIAMSSLIRKESRGCHYRRDYPNSSIEWIKNTVIKKNDKSAMVVTMTDNPTGMASAKGAPHDK